MMTREQENLLKGLNSTIFLSIQINKNLNFCFLSMVAVLAIHIYVIQFLNLEYGEIIILGLTFLFANTFYILKKKLFKSLNEEIIEGTLKHILSSCNEYLLKSTKEDLKKSTIYSNNIKKDNSISFCLQNIDNVLLKYIVKKQIEKEEKRETYE